MNVQVPLKWYGAILIALIVLVVSVTTRTESSQDKQTPEQIWWDFQAIDTMKYSRDLSREKLNVPSFDLTIDTHTRNIAATCATHIAIATPYDEEFLPILKRWVAAARKYELKIWFRGNWSGWEEWFDHERITRDQHLAKTRQFILDNPDLFEDGDIFTGCPECENGGPGDPRMNGDAKGHKKFLIDEYKMTKQAFKHIGKDVQSNFNSMNGDVARLIMDEETTKALDGLVVVDHYVKTPEQLNNDITALAKQSKGKVILGEFGAPIPDIHGPYTEEQQAQWIEGTMKLLSTNPNLVGMSYWVDVGGSTQLWENDKPRKGVDSLHTYYEPELLFGNVLNESGKPIKNAIVSFGTKQVVTDSEGLFTLLYVPIDVPVIAKADNYIEKRVTLTENPEFLSINLRQDESKQKPTFWDWLKRLFD